MEKFVVSARKYRPANFNSVVGQAHITDTLRNAIKFGQLSHAYLFTGPRGVGKTTCARIFAKAINCMNPTAESEACGVCESCLAFEQGRSFNIHELDAASNNSVDDIRALNEKVRIAPQVGKYSLYIIDEVHMLSTGAFNAFLKTLEEPPHYAIFILATTEKHKILPTILSRCQSYDFKRIRLEDIVQYLKFIAQNENVDYDEESLHLIAAKADGGMRDALSMFDRVVSFCGNQLRYDRVAECIGSLDLNTYFETMDMVMAEDFGSLLMLLDSIVNKGFEAGQFVSGLAEHIRNLVVVKNPATMSLLEVSSAMAQRYQMQASKMDIDMLLNAMNLINTVDNTYRNATNRRLHVELGLVKLCGLKKKDNFIADIYPMPQIVASPSVNRDNAQAAQLKAAGGGSDSGAAQKTNAADNLVANTIESGQNSKQNTIAVTDNNSTSGNSAENQTSKSEPRIELSRSSTQVQEMRSAANAELVGNNKAATNLAGDENQRGSRTDDGARNTNAGRSSVSRFSLSGHMMASNAKAENNIAAGADIDQKAAVVDNGKTDTQIAETNSVQANNNATQYEAEALSDQEVEARLKHRFTEIIDLWNQRHRPRLATVLSENTITGNRIIIKVPHESPAQEIIQNKIQIEMDIRQIIGVVAVVEVEICDEPMKYAPVSVEQKLQHLINLNPMITKLRDELDLTL